MWLQLTTYKNAMNQRGANLQVIGAWWSKKTATSPITLTTQMSAARLWQLRALCMSYPGPVSVVLYIGIIRGRVEKEPGEYCHSACFCGSACTVM